MPDLPKEIWQGDGERDDAAEPDPRLCKVATLPRAEECNHQADSEKGKRVLIFYGQSGDEAEPKPKAGRAAVDDANEKVNAAGPKERLEDIHGVEVSQRQINQGAERGQRRQSNGPGAAAELAREKAGENHRERMRDRGKQAQRKK